MSGPVSASSSTDDQLYSDLFASIATRPFYVMQYTIDTLKRAKLVNDKKSYPKLINLYCRASLAAAGVEDFASIDHPLDAIYSHSYPLHKRKAIALFGLVLLANHRDFWSETNVSLRITALFDEAFKDSLYRLADIEVGEQSYKKLQALIDLLNKTEREIIAVVDGLHHLDDIGNFKSQYLKRMNAGAARLLVQPFLPDALRDQRLMSLLTFVQAYTDGKGAEILERYKEVEDALNVYEKEVVQLGTAFGDSLLLRAAVRLRELVEKDFQNTPFSKPAKLQILASEKRYPLDEAGKDLDLGVQIQNVGPGYAFDVEVVAIGVDVELHKPQLHLGGLEPSIAKIKMPATIVRPAELLMIEITCRWRNFDGSTDQSVVILEFRGQMLRTDWGRASTEDPYSLAPVTEVSELVGRAEILNRLLALTRGEKVESAFIRGQKRVGKTSIAKTLATQLRKLFPSDYVIGYLEAGDYVSNDAKKTIESLGRQLCKCIQRADSRFSALGAPTFDGALSPITDFLQDALNLVPRCRMLFILDEFDELPSDLYRRGLVGDAFFRTLRSISNKNEFGFILVGSEKMEFVLSCQGDALNKFIRISVDYFDKHSWPDFQELVRKPSADYLEFSDAAVEEVYKYSAGNPYFAKLICQALFSYMTARHDGHVTAEEVEKSIEITLSQIGANSFQHFWEDGIFEPPPRSEEVSITRRKIVLAFAECLRNQNQVRRSELVNAARGYQVTESQLLNELREFERRQVFINEGGVYRCKVQLFSEWLRNKGYQEILTTFVDRESLIQFKKQDETNRVKDEEVTALSKRWGLFQGKRVSEEEIRSWIHQFEGNDRRRLMFRILQGIRFYSTEAVREKMREAHGIVMRGTTWQRKPKQPKRRDIIVTALGGLGNSGSEYARRYADENMIYPDNVVPINDVEALLDKREDVQTVVMIDDFIGTGESCCASLDKAAIYLIPMLARNHPPKLFLVVVASFIAGQKSVLKKLEKLGLQVNLHVCDFIEGVFSEQSAIFPEHGERLRAKDCAYEYGIKLLADSPLGYGDCEAAVVFDNKIPNNCLTILWKEAKEWKALFRRT